MPVYRLSKAHVKARGVNLFLSKKSALAYPSHTLTALLGMPRVWQGYTKGLGRGREGAEYLLPGSWIEEGKRSRTNTETNWAL